MLLFEIEEKTLALSTKELERQKQLLKRKIISDPDYDNQQAAHYAQLAKVQNLKNSLNLILLATSIVFGTIASTLLVLLTLFFAIKFLTNR